ncbi:MAG: DUF4954 family protein [Prevotellaceae bacterium]|jgi:hypothetical protein|nr:DUF4954 family protein [Prevotellaceae bacterium]
MRPLTPQEIEMLLARGCTAENWQNIAVDDEFLPDFLQNVHFSGEISLGKHEKIFTLRGGITKHSGIYNCHLHNVAVGNDIYINGIHNYISNYIIENEAFVENCNSIFVDGKSAFGNGVPVAVINENGARAIPVFEKLSAALAYMLALYRCKTKFIAATERLIADFTEQQRSEKGKIGRNAKIVNCGNIINVKIDENAELQSVIKLENGSIGSSCFVGEGVQAKDFIFCSDAKISGAANIERCFVGEATQIDKGFSAVNCAFFANCQMFNGEAVSVFAAPYTVSHHKSTLLIAGYFAFLNAGSAANQSNHMYKSGAVHQGVMERGTKLSSNSYIAFPAHAAPFTTILGTHKAHFDTADFPFSYIVENQGESYLIPAIALHSSGIVRDTQKWKKRDLRKTAENIDLINFELLNPFTIGKIYKAIGILKKLLHENKNAKIIYFHNVKIKKTAAEKALEIYWNVIYYFIENQIFKVQKNMSANLVERLSHYTTQENDDLLDQPAAWLDLAGLIAPKVEIEKVIEDVENGNCTLQNIQNQLVSIFNNYKTNSMKWTVSLVEKLLNKKANDFTKDDIENLQAKSSVGSRSLHNAWIADAEKEFNSDAKIGYFSGDFEQVRGAFKKEDFINQLNNNILS